LQVVPGIRISAPRDESSLREQLGEAVKISDAPTVVRFPKGSVTKDIPALRRTNDGVDILHESAANDVLIVAVGSFVPTALKVAELLANQGIGASVVDPRWILPVSMDLVELSRDHRLVVTMEDGVRVGGFGTRLRQVLRANEVDTGLNEVGVPAEFLEHAEREEILERLGLTPQAIARDIVAQVLGSKVPHAKPIPDSQAFDEFSQDLPK